MKFKVYLPAVTVLVIACLFSACQTGKNIKKDGLPVYKGYVNDYFHALQKVEAENLAEIMKGIEDRKGVQMAVLIVGTTGPITIEKYSLQVATAWGLGVKNNYKAVLFTLAVSDRKLRMEVGNGLGDVLPNETCQKIVDSMVAHLTDGDFYGGVLKGVTQAAKILAD